LAAGFLAREKESSRMTEDHVLYRDFSREYPTIVRGRGVYLFDGEGTRYLDASGGPTLINIGHGVQEVADAVHRQASEIAFVHGSTFRSQPLLDLAALMAEMAPPGMNKVYVTPGGTEANESAMKLGRIYHRGNGNEERYKVIGRRQSFHGTCLGALSMSGHPGLRRNMGPWLLDFPKIMPPYCYRCPLDKTYPECKVTCADDLERAILLNGPDTILAHIVEPLSGASIAAMAPPLEYYPRIREICDRYDVLLIDDEVMTGFGRTGANFALDHWGVIPDIITVGKGAGGGYVPLGAIIVSDKVVDIHLRKGTGTFFDGYSHSGDPVSCAGALATLQVIKRDRLVERARTMGEYLADALCELQDRHPTIGDLRGKGLMRGIEFVKDRETKEPFAREVGFARRLARAVFDRGVVITAGSSCIDGIAGDEMRITPPFIIARNEIDEMIAALDLSLTELERELL
jgi:adenosylmethionine-8-amino-7-oxononanoate aminotransferase